MTITSDVRTIAVQVERNISDVLKQLMARRDETNADIGALLGWDEQTIGRKRRNERRWFAWEVRALAAYYGKEVGVFYDGPDALFRLNDAATDVGIRRYLADEAA